MLRRKTYMQNLGLCKLIFFLNTGTSQYSTTGLFSCPCYLPVTAIGRFLFSLPTFLLQSYSTGETTFPTAERRGPWAEETRGSPTFPVILSSLLSCLYALPGYHQFLSNNSWHQPEKGFEDPIYIFIIGSIYHSALYK